ncbi:MAG TPA: DUF2505 domain-containing protein [Polyangiales bacterium]|nr:DUF2505 domain-containing protein [Polyangiales bacterium]
MRYTIKHIIETDVDSYWKLFFDAEFNRAMFVDGLAFTVYNVLEDVREPNGAVKKRVECAPKIELPAPARKIFGDSTTYTEIGRFDPAQRKYFAEVVPKVAADKIKTSSETWMEPRGDKRCERLVQVDTTVKIFGLGGLLEGFIEQQTRDQYTKAADFTNRWIRDKGL